MATDSSNPNPNHIEDGFEADDTESSSPGYGSSDQETEEYLNKQQYTVFDDDFEYSEPTGEMPKH